MNHGYTEKTEGGQVTVTTTHGTFTAKSRDDAFRLAMLAERRAKQREILKAREERRSTRSRVARLRGVIL
jgi:hypothetical protein